LAIIFYTFATFNWYLALPLAIVEFLAMHVGIVKFVIPVPTPDAMLKTPYFSSIFQATAFWVGVTWLIVIMRGRIINLRTFFTNFSTNMSSPLATSHMVFTNLIFFASYTIAMTSFYKAVFTDPGFINKNLSREEQRAAVIDLAEEEKLDIRHFCFTCLVSHLLLYRSIHLLFSANQRNTL
jgi:hypothetical protein